MRSKPDMKRFSYVLAIIVVTIFSSCQKQQTEEERTAEVERQVQQRLAAEHQAEQQQQLAQRESELAAREKSLADNEAAANASTAPVHVAKRADTESGDSDTASYSTFYTRLEPQGVWRETSDYGYVWQPREAQESRSWRPYTNGHWAYTDGGWTWVSDEPFGWATYHYGRWARLRNIGWVWVPGDEWAPAWVSWRRSDDYVGWAPLPPEARFERASGIHNWADSYYDIGPDQYCFVPTRELGAQRVERVIVPAEQNLTIVNQTTNVTNITYNNTTIVNQGPNYDELRSRTQQPIPRMRLERQININVENPRAVVRGEVIEVPAPLIARGQSVERPRNVKETITQTVVDHGWEAIPDRQAVEKVRVKIRSEATPPANAPSKVFVKPVQTAAVPATSKPVSPSPSAPATVAPTQTALPSSPGPTATPLQTAPAASPQTPGATIAEQPSPTPPRQQLPPKFRSPRPLESVSPAPNASVPRVSDTARAMPSITASPLPSATLRSSEAATASPRSTVNLPTEPNGTPARRSPTPLGTPLRVPTPTPSPSVSVKPEASGTPSISATMSESKSGAPGIGAVGQSKNQREATKELRKQERATEREQKKGQQGQGATPAYETPASTTTATPNSLGSSSASPEDGQQTQPDEKKKLKRQRQQASESSVTLTPFPTATPY
jgi:hypothetical protein